MTKRVRVNIYGRVQGVFFRFNTKKVADRLNVNGWVRNNSDGSVEAVFEGEKEAVDKVVEWCKKGTIASKVEDVKIKEEEFKNEFNDFYVIS